MKICVIGKYPPIEGGVSTHTYWMARGLAQLGHEVHVVTNADEVEDAYRMRLEPDDEAWMELTGERSGGRVRIYQPEPFSPAVMKHIPEANPFVSKLASVATGVVRRHACEAILAYYYEPYGVAGWLASRWTGKPLLIKHAGSDLDQLFAVPDLATTYKEILRSADAVITQPYLAARFLGMGVEPRRIRRDVPYPIPPEVFRPDAEPLDIARLALPSPGNLRPFDPARPTIGVYGKIGVTKGTFDLIAALGLLAREGGEFNFVAMIGAGLAGRVRQALADAGILSQTYVLPLLPNWKVPGFIRACTAVCFLERGFPVAIHGPMVPREILACGTCLVLSGEIAAKQRYRQELRDSENVLLIQDPKDRGALAGVLRGVVSDPARARLIGQAGLKISRLLEGDVTYGAGWEQLLTSFATGPGPSDVPVGLEEIVPELRPFLQRWVPGLFEEFVASGVDRNRVAAAARLCRIAIARLQASEVAGSGRAIAALRYLLARLDAGHDPEGEVRARFAVMDCLQRAPVTVEAVWHLFPVRGEAVHIEKFEHDVSAVFSPLALAGTMPEAVDTELAHLPEGPMTVLFQRTPNLSTRELRIDDATCELLKRCDSTRTTAAVVADMAGYFGRSADELARPVLKALEKMYGLGVIVFGRQTPGGRWRGGSRMDDGRGGSRTSHP